ncbi:RNA-directed DNA polymerase, eukaryota, reverse transcriptase zinc-binding domain protein [Tanacetum coccineum]
MSNNCRYRWRWRLGDDGEFTVKVLARLIEENNLVPKKVNIFVWRALKGRLPVYVELDRRDIDLDSVLCPRCNDIVETCTHGLVTCDLAMSVLVKVFNWWNVKRVNSFTIVELFSHSGGVKVPTFLFCVWKAVV